MVLFRHLKEYFQNSSIHGLHYIAENDRHWTERLFWAVCCLLSWYASIRLVLSSLSEYRNNAVSFGVETSYLDWNTSFPAISICETENPSAVTNYTTSVYGEDRDYNIDEVIAEIAFFQGTSYYLKEFCSEENSNCPLNDYGNIARSIRSSCMNMLSECTWNGYTCFNCCQYFQNEQTEVGNCYTLNSNSLQNSDLTFNSNRQNGLARLLIKTTSTVQVYFHSENDKPFYNSEASDYLKSIPNVHVRYSIAVKDVENESELRLVDTQQRKCRFAQENILTLSDDYSYSGCLVECRMKSQLQFCNCTSHLMPGTSVEQHCDYEGLLCLNSKYIDLVVLKPSWDQSPGLSCDCLPSCEELDIDIVSQETFSTEDEYSALELIISHLPSEKFKRNVVRKRVDVIANVGGAVSLFVGASLLSFCELIYYFTIRLGTRYVSWAISQGKRLKSSLQKPEELPMGMHLRMYNNYSGYKNMYISQLDDISKILKRKK